MQVVTSLKSIQLDALRETASIGAGHAATALSQMTGSTIMIKVPSITVASAEELPTHVGAMDDPVAAVLLQMLGDLTGRAALVLPQTTAFRVVDMMLGHTDGSTTALGDLETSAIKEAGNILCGAYLNALSEFLGVLLLPSPPTLVMDRADAVLSAVMGPQPQNAEAVLCIESEFVLSETAHVIRGYFLLLPDAASVHAMLRALRLS